MWLALVLFQIYRSLFPLGCNPSPESWFGSIADLVIYVEQTVMCNGPWPVTEQVRGRGMNPGVHPPLHLSMRSLSVTLNTHMQMVAGAGVGAGMKDIRQFEKIALKLSW